MMIGKFKPVTTLTKFGIKIVDQTMPLIFLSENLATR